ncbi:hypothetical protein [Stenotrophomonas muris]|uniref:hypothetical protein n=1 Tax=Stenotrophomonas muris TaxID=2963283 RepID=UPI0039C62ABB
MKIDYEIVMADESARLCAEVETYLRSGFVCQGGIWFGHARHGGWIYMQAMTRTTLEEGDPA